MKIGSFHIEYCIPLSRKRKNSSFQKTFIIEGENIELFFHDNLMQ